MKLSKSTENKINKDKSEENVPHLEMSELISLLQYSKQWSTTFNFLYTFVSEKSYD